MLNHIGSQGYEHNNAIYNNVSAVDKDPAAAAINKAAGIGLQNEDNNTKVGKVKSAECQTCKNRKYMDRSDQGNVSFKSPTHVSPQASFSRVSAHEQEHVANAVNEGNKEGNKLVNASVKLKMSVCPECGTTYVAGGTTTTTIKYNVKNPYDNARKTVEGSLLRGNNIDSVA